MASTFSCKQSHFLKHDGKMLHMREQLTLSMLSDSWNYVQKSFVPHLETGRLFR